MLFLEICERVLERFSRNFFKQFFFEPVLQASAVSQSTQACTHTCALLAKFSKIGDDYEIVALCYNTAHTHTHTHARTHTHREKSLHLAQPSTYVCAYVVCACTGTLPIASIGHYSQCPYAVLWDATTP